MVRRLWGAAPLSAIMARMARTTSMMATSRGQLITHSLQVVQAYRMSSDSKPSRPSWPIFNNWRVRKGLSTEGQGQRPEHRPHCIHWYTVSPPIRAMASETSKNGVAGIMPISLSGK